MGTKLKYNSGGVTHEIPLTTEKPQGKRLAVRHGGQTFYAPLADAGDATPTLSLGSWTKDDTVYTAAITYNGDGNLTTNLGTISGASLIVGDADGIFSGVLTATAGTSFGEASCFFKYDTNEVEVPAPEKPKLKLTPPFIAAVNNCTYTSTITTVADESVQPLFYSLEDAPSWITLQDDVITVHPTSSVQGGVHGTTGSMAVVRVIAHGGGSAIIAENILCAAVSQPHVKYINTDLPASLAPNALTTFYHSPRFNNITEITSPPSLTIAIADSLELWRTSTRLVSYAGANPSVGDYWNCPTMTPAYNETMLDLVDTDYEITLTYSAPSMVTYETVLPYHWGKMRYANNNSASQNVYLQSNSNSMVITSSGQIPLNSDYGVFKPSTHCTIQGFMPNGDISLTSSAVVSINTSKASLSGRVRQDFYLYYDAHEQVTLSDNTARTTIIIANDKTSPCTKEIVWHNAVMNPNQYPTIVTAELPTVPTSVNAAGTQYYNYNNQPCKIVHVGTSD